jgi:DMSO/TMAO reductase YedYZ molybdopterin-dependent catalytic subunit
MITGAVDHPRTLTVDDLSHEASVTQSVSLRTGRGTLAGAFTGPLLWTLIQEAGPKLDTAKKNEIVRHVVVITARDGYSTVLSLGELAPDFGGEQAILAFQQDGKPITGNNGFARLVLPGDKEAARAVGGVARIEVK